MARCLGRRNPTAWYVTTGAGLRGHQFGVWAGQLGDGRGILLANNSWPMALQWTGI